MVFRCLECISRQGVTYVGDHYEIHDLSCGYDAEFTERALVDLAPFIAAHDGRQGHWKCPRCRQEFAFEPYGPGYKVDDPNCGLRLVCRKGSPVYKRTV